MNRCSRIASCLAVLVTLLSFLLPVDALADSGSSDGKKSWLKRLAAPKDSAETNEPTAVLGVRGLDEPGQAQDTQARDYAAIDRLEKVQVTSPDLQQFKKEGQLP